MCAANESCRQKKKYVLCWYKAHILFIDDRANPDSQDKHSFTKPARWDN